MLKGPLSALWSKKSELKPIRFHNITKKLKMLPHHFTILSGIDLFSLLYIPSMFFLASVFGPFYVLGIHWNSPCKPSLIGYFLLEECIRSKEAVELIGLTVIWNTVLKIIVYIGNI